MTNYREHPALNWSKLRAMAQSPLAFATQEDVQETDAMRLGTEVHRLLLTPDEPAPRIAVVPAEYLTESGRLSTAKAAKAWVAEQGDVVIYTPDELAKFLDTTAAMAHAAQSHLTASKWLAGIESAERELYWSQPSGSELVECKGKADAVIVVDGKRMLVDVKTCSGSRGFSPSWFARRVIDLGYHGQLAMYARGLAADGVQVDGWGWLVIQSEAPHDVMCLTASERMMAAGDALFLDLLHKYASSSKTGVWPGVAAEAVEIDLPKWAQGADSAEEF